MASVDYKISNFDGLCFKSGLYVGTDTNYTKIINSSGAFVGSISPTSLSLPNGSVGAPPLNFGQGTGGSTTGIYATGANAVGFAANGVNVGGYSSTGAWSIGPTTATNLNHQLYGSTMTWTVGSTGTGSNDINLIAVSKFTSANAGQLRIYSRYDDGSTTRDLAQILTQNTSATASSAGGNFFIQTATTAGTLTTALKITETQAVQIVGTSTNDSAAAGYYGEYVESVVSTPTNLPGATTVWGNLTSISLTAGDWDVSGNFYMINNGATVAGVLTNQIAISVNSGATTTDHVSGSNVNNVLTTSSVNDRSMSIPNYRISLSATTTVYFKANLSYTVATPQYQCRLSARRVR